jgi:hypothetical protein
MIVKFACGEFNTPAINHLCFSVEISSDEEILVLYKAKPIDCQSQPGATDAIGAAEEAPESEFLLFSLEDFGVEVIAEKYLLYSLFKLKNVQPVFY